MADSGISYQYFKGYVPTKNKKCTVSFKNKTAKELHSLEKINRHPEFAGILAEETILIDIDEIEQSELLFNIVQKLKIPCRVYKTTRGKHFLFKNKGVDLNKTGAVLAIGLKADIKLGKRNSYSILRFDGKDREILQDTDNPAELPKWLLPLSGIRNASFIEMKSGDGRNQALFNHILPLQSAGFSNEEARDCIRLINKFILKDPLSESELETILRDAAFQKPVFFKGNSFLFDKFADYLKNNSHVIKIDNNLHVYDEGVYVSGKQRIEYEMIKIIPALNRTKRNEVYDYLNINIQENHARSNENLIAFRNGIYNISTGKLQKFSPDHVITNRIDWDYNPNAKSELVDTVLANISCKDKNIRALLEELIGYCFYRRNELGKAFILVGEKENGKSTFLDMIATVLGEKNISALDLADLNKRFLNAEIFGKLANIGDDIGDEFIPNTGVFKKLVTGEGIDGIERKGQDPFKLYNYSKLLFSANNIPRLGKGKDSAAIIRRLIIIPFEAKFNVNNPDFKPYIKYDLRKQESVEYLILLGLQGLKRILKNHCFTDSAKVASQVKEYERLNNPILMFFDDIDESEVINEPTSEVYRKYQEFCIRNNLQPVSNIVFSREVTKHYGCEVKVKKIQKKIVKVFSNE